MRPGIFFAGLIFLFAGCASRKFESPGVIRYQHLEMRELKLKTFFDALLETLSRREYHGPESVTVAYFKKERYTGKTVKQHANRQTELTGDFCEGYPCGSWVHYTPEGFLEKRILYTNDTDFYEHFLEGKLIRRTYRYGDRSLSIEYDAETGRKKEEELIRPYNTERYLTRWNAQGQAYEMRNDTVYFRWDENKTILLDTGRYGYIGKKKGEWKHFYEDGKLRLLENYSYVYRDGPSREYYQDGTLKAEGEYVKDKREGVWIFYFSSGKKERVVTYSAGQEHGPAEEFYESGGSRSKGSYCYDRPVGRWIFYDSAGRVERVKEH